MSKKDNNGNKNVTTVAKKRGRKSKAEIEQLKNAENISIKLEEAAPVITVDTNFIDEVNNSDDSDSDDKTQNSIVNSPMPSISDNKPAAKKRGRKPKGGKIIQQILPLSNSKETIPNVILHLKCSLKDLTNNNLLSSNLEGFSFSSSNNNLTYDVLNNGNINLNDFISTTNKQTEYDVDVDTNDYDLEFSKNRDTDIRDIWKKLKMLEHNLHVNNIDNKKSACFWDTCEFDNPPIYIPKHFINDTYHVYGCFCSPECAVAHLMEENIDTSIKFERYQLMNHIYSKVYDYNKNIKPAPNPYYMLEKFYGNLTIQEYRSLLRNERLFLVVDKPLTRIMPELHEDNDDFIINNKIIPTNNIKLRKVQKKQTKTNILNERFGLVQN